MKKKFKLDEIDCAVCAGKMEAAIKKVEGVEDASVNFIMQTMTITAADENFNEVIDKVVDVCAKIEPDCKIIR